MSIESVGWIAVFAFGLVGILSVLRWYQGGQVGMSDPAIAAAAAYCVATVDAQRHLNGAPADELTALDRWLDAYTAFNRLDGEQRARATAALKTMSSFPTGAPQQIWDRAERLFGGQARDDG